MDEIDKTIQQGQSAERILESEVYQEAIKQVKSEAWEMFQNSGVTDSAKRESAFFFLQAIDKLDYKLKAMLFNAKIEEEKIKRRGRPPKV